MITDLFKNPNFDVTEIGTQVICDGPCGEDWSFRSESGGFLFGSRAYCPNCAEEALKSIKKYKEEYYIKGYCPTNVSFWNWVISLRKGNDTITIITEGPKI